MAPLNRRTQIFAWIVAALLATTGLSAILLREFRPSVPRHALYVVGIPEKGAALFFGDKHCAICHAVNGRGGHVAPDLSAIRPGKPAMAWLTTTLWNHAPGMWRQMRSVGSPNLSQEDMAHILAFLYQATTTDHPGDAAAGQHVFSAKGCARCHSVRSTGGHSAPDLGKVSTDPILWVHAMWNHAQFMVDPITREIGSWPQFQAAEMNDLIAYVTGETANSAAAKSLIRGSAERGWQVFQIKCIQCHAVRGNGGHAGPELGPDHDLPHTNVQLATVLWNHAPAMIQRAHDSAISAPTLQGDEIPDILQFLASLQYFEPSGSPFIGERLFQERGCARCHGPRAAGTTEGPKLRSGPDAFTTVSLATSLWRHGPAMRSHAEQLGISWPSLEPGDVGDIISFLNQPDRQQ